MLRVWQHSVFWLALAATGPAFAEDAFLVRPAQCEPILTVQSRGCKVQTLSRCSDPVGAPWRWESYDDQGVAAVSNFDKDGVQLKTLYPRTSVTIDLDPTQSSSTPPAEIALSGHGVEHTKGEVIAGDRRLKMFVYRDIERLDPPMLLDGTPLVRLRFHGTRTLSPPLRAERQDFMNYLDPQTGFLLAGESLLPDADGKLSPAGQPVQLIHPGEAGFDGTLPKYDCLNLSLNVTDEKATYS